MGAITVEENIRIGVAFDSGKVIPIWFRWNGRYYKVKSVNFFWTTNQGNGKLRHYAVTDGANTYELCFNSRTLDWTLERIAVE